MKDNILVVFWLMLLIALFNITARADDWAMFGGPAILDNQTSGESKIFGFRTDTKWIMGLYHTSELGGWVDNRPGMKKSVYAATKLGVQPGQQNGLFGKAFIGPALISSTDASLGGHLQFSEDIGVGVRDQESMMSITYKHFSSAGLASPNKGRDWITFEMGFIW